MTQSNWLPQIQKFYERLAETELLGNSLQAWMIVVLVLALAFITISMIKRFVLMRLKVWSQKTISSFDDLLVELLDKHIAPSLFIIVAFHALKDLHLRPSVSRGLDVFLTLALAWTGFRIVISFINEALKNYWKRHSEEHTDAREKSLNGFFTRMAHGGIANVVHQTCCGQNIGQML